MKIFTSYYANIVNIPKEYFLVATSGAIPQDIETIVDSWNQSLAPSKSIFVEYQKKHDQDLYVSRFKNERLSKIDWFDKFEQWQEKAIKNNKQLDNIVLLCYEHPTDFCHRQILAESIEQQFNTTVVEFGYENYKRINYKMEMENNMDLLF